MHVIPIPNPHFYAPISGDTHPCGRISYPYSSLFPPLPPSLNPAAGLAYVSKTIDWYPKRKKSPKITTPCFILLCLLAIANWLKLPLTCIPDRLHPLPSPKYPGLTELSQDNIPLAITQRWGKIGAILNPHLAKIEQQFPFADIYNIRGVIYTIVDIRNGAVYVGQSKQSTLERFKQHWHDAHNPRKYKPNTPTRPLMLAMRSSSDPGRDFRVFPVAVIPKSTYEHQDAQESRNLFSSAASIIERDFIKSLKSLARWNEGGMNEDMPARRLYKGIRRKRKRGYIKRPTPHSPTTVAQIRVALGPIIPNNLGDDNGNSQGIINELRERFEPKPLVWLRSNRYVQFDTSSDYPLFNIRRKLQHLFTITRPLAASNPDPITTVSKWIATSR